MNKFVKSLYTKNINEEYVDKAIMSGIDTLFLPASTDKEVLSKYIDMGVYVISTINYIQPHSYLQENDQFFDGMLYYNWLPCPTNKDVIRRLLEHSLNLHSNGLCNAICIDFSNSNGYIEDWEYYKCKCERCKQLSLHQQRMRNVELINDSLQGISLYSITPPNPYILGMSDWWLNNGYDNRSNIKSLEKMGIRIYNSNKVSSLKDVKRQLNNPYADGYWLDLPSRTLDDKYFAELKILNDDYTRDSIWFKFKKYLIRKNNYGMV
jgi:hypothetical protein